MVLIRQLSLWILLSLIPSAIGLPDEAAGRVVSVVSGDSLGIEMLIGDSRTRHVDSIKLADIDVPSTVTAEGKAAKAYVASLLKNKTVYLDIDDNSSQGRNQWSQLICLVYLMDESCRPLWPPVNKIMVDAGHAALDDDAGNEFNASSWWGEPPSFTVGEKSDILLAMLRGYYPSQRPPGDLQAATTGSDPGIQPVDSNEVSILKRVGTSGSISIGYRK